MRHLKSCQELEDLDISYMSCISYTVTASISVISTLRNLKSLNLSINSSSTYQDLKSIFTRNALKHLVYLNLVIPFMNNELLESFTSNCQNIEELWLQIMNQPASNYLHLLKIDVISRLHNLKKLYLRFPVTAYQIINLFRNRSLKKLKKLYLTSGSIPNANNYFFNDHVIQTIAQCCDLESLDINIKYIMKNFTISSFSQFNSLKRLYFHEHAGVQFLSFQAKDFIDMFSSGNLKHLETLGFRTFHGVDDTVIKLIALKCPKLQFLNLGGNTIISEEAIKSLIQNCKSLKNLHLTENFKCSKVFLLELKRHVSTLYWCREEITPALLEKIPNSRFKK